MEPVLGQINFKVGRRASNSRSLLPSEALVDHFGIAIYSEVLSRLRVR